MFNLLAILASPVFVIGGNIYVLVNLKQEGKQKMILAVYSVIFCINASPISKEMGVAIEETWYF